MTRGRGPRNCCPLRRTGCYATTTNESLFRAGDETRTRNHRIDRLAPRKQGFRLAAQDVRFQPVVIVQP